MAIYKYKVIREAKEYEEEKEFTDKGALYAYVRKNDWSLISAEEVRTRKISLKFFSFSKKIKMAEQITFAKNMAVMIDAGLSVSRAISILQKQSKNKNFISVMDSLLTSINGGEAFSKALEAYPNIFSSIFVSMVRAGEESGKLAYSLRVIAGQLEKSYQLTKKIKGAMIYPSVIVCVMIVIGIVLMVYMVPTLTATFRGLNITLPLPTRIVIYISDFLRANILLTLLAIIGLVTAAVSGLKTERGQKALDLVSLKMPMINTMVKEVNAARTARTLSSLISSGVDIVVAINITTEVLSNHYFKEILEKAEAQVQVGEPLSASLSKPGTLYPVFVGEMLAVGEETGKLTDMLDNIASYYEGEVDQKTKDLSTIIEPFLMILIGAAVGVFAIAMMLPTYSLVDAIQ